MIDQAGVIDWAIPLWLPEEKRYGTNSNSIAVMHSLEANYRGKYGLSQNIRDMAVQWPDLASKDRATVIASLRALYWAWDEPTRPWTAWHTTTFKEGFVVQHAPLHWMIAHGHECNDDGSGHEAEGRAPEPLTRPQVLAYDRLLQDLEEWKGYPFRRENGRIVDGQIVEHKECPRASTACPGGRYAPLYAYLKSEPERDEQVDRGDDEMTPQERELLWNLARITAGWGQVENARDEDMLADRIDALDQKNINLLLAHQRLNAGVHRIQEAMEDLADGGSLSDDDRETIIGHLRGLAAVIGHGDPSDPLAEDDA